MAEVISPLALCLAGGITAACVQSVVPELAAYGVSGPSILWGGVGAYAGDMLRQMQAQDAGKTYTRMTRGALAISGALGAAGGPWIASLFFSGTVPAVAGCSAITGALCMPLLGGLVPIILDVFRATAERFARK